MSQSIKHWLNEPDSQTKRSALKSQFLRCFGQLSALNCECKEAVFFSTTEAAGFRKRNEPASAGEIAAVSLEKYPSLRSLYTLADRGLPWHVKDFEQQIDSIVSEAFDQVYGSVPPERLGRGES